MWPTRENFTDPSISKRQKEITLPEFHSTAQPTLPIKATTVHTLTSEFTQLAPLKRKHSDFENFGTKRGRRSQSRYRQDPGLTIPNSRPRYENYQLSDEESDDEEAYSVHESMEEDNDDQSNDNIESSVVGEDDMQDTLPVTDMDEHVPGTLYSDDDDDDNNDDDDEDCGSFLGLDHAQYANEDKDDDDDNDGSMLNEQAKHDDYEKDENTVRGRL